MARIRFCSQDAITKALAKLPPPPPKLIPKKRPRKKIKLPPCIEMIERGMVTPGRDVAAFALARFYLAQGLTSEEIFGILQAWDKKNQPPLHDDHLLETKIRSAEKGYGFGCKSIQGDPFLNQFCVGEAKCGWLAESVKEKKKLGLIKEVSFYETATHLYEEIYKDKHASFISYELATKKIEYISSIELPDVTLVPIDKGEFDVLDDNYLVKVPSDVEEYGSTLELVEGIKHYLRMMWDVEPDYWYEFAAWYVLMTWVYQKLPSVSYIRFIGDFSTGKTRGMQTIGYLCYKATSLSGCITQAPLYRLLKRWAGTTLIEEVDKPDSAETQDIITILNTGYERSAPVVRCRKDNPDILDIMPVFGPKLFTARKKFKDEALESRCLSIRMLGMDRASGYKEDQIPGNILTAHHPELNNLRNKLLMWRFHHYPSTNMNDLQNLDLSLDGKKLEPRLQQTSEPFALAFMNYPEVLHKFKVFIHEYQAMLREQRGDTIYGQIVWAIAECVLEHGIEYITSSLIVTKLNETYDAEINTKKFSYYRQYLGLSISKSRRGGAQGRYLDLCPNLMRKLCQRYVPDYSKFEEIWAEPEEEKEPEVPDSTEATVQEKSSSIDVEF